MSSRSHHNGNSAQPTTRSGNGDPFPASLWARMESIGGSDEKENQKAVGILASELQITQRQAEVLHWIAEGKTNGEIATILSCSINTVKAHLKDIFQRLGLHSRSAATACAYRAHISHARRSNDLPERVIPKNDPTQ